MNTHGARVLVTDPAQGRVFEEYVPRDLVSSEAQQKVYDAMVSTLPAIHRRTPIERREAMERRSVKDAIDFYRRNAQWPNSVIEVLKFLAIRDHDPSLASDGGIEDFIHQGKALARYIVETGARQQAEQDQKKVTLDWSGH